MGFPVLRLTAIRGGRVDLNERKVGAWTAEGAAPYLVAKGDFFVARGNGSLRLVGRGALLEADPDPVAFPDTLIRIRTYERMILPSYLREVWHSLETRQQIERQAKTTAGIYKVNQGGLELVELPIPPLHEQQRIVEAIESYSTRLDDAVATLERVERNLKRYRASVLTSAIEGRLVPTEAQIARQAGHTFEAAIDLLSRFVPPPRPNRWNSRSSDVVLGHAALAVGNPRTTLPEGWSWIPLVDVARMESGHTPSRAHPEWWDGDVPWLSIPDARDHDGKTIQDTTYHTNAAGLANSAARILPSGTVSICRTAFSIGYVVVLGRPMATSQDFVNWTPTGAVSSHWLRLVFGADREALRRFGKGSVNKTIYFPEWLSIHIALPPLTEQERIVKEVDRLLSLAESTEVSVCRSLRQCDALRQATLKWAFEGRLTDQDLNDESVSALFERIKAEREVVKRAKVTGLQRIATKKQVRA